MQTVSKVLQDTISGMEHSTLYELTRGLMLSECDRKQLLEVLFDELDKRAEAARQEIAKRKLAENNTTS